MKQSIRIVILLFIGALQLQVKAQDPHFSQFFANPIYLNPAFSGTIICPRLVINSRTQNPSFGAPYNSFSISYDVYKEQISGGIGFIATSDFEGDLISTHTLSGIYAYNVNIGPNWAMKFGVQASFFQKRYNWDNFIFGDELQQNYGVIYNTKEPYPGQLYKMNPDFTVGVLGHNRSQYVGVAVHHITQPDQGILNKRVLPRKFTVHSGHLFDLNPDVLRGNRMRRRIDDPTVGINFMYNQQRYFQQFNYGVFFNIFPMIFGAQFRHSLDNADAVVLLLGAQTMRIKVGYSYDIPISDFNEGSGGAHELSIGYKMLCKPPKKRIRAINCPTF